MSEKGEGQVNDTPPRAKVRRYVEWMSRGSRTGRVAYVVSERNLPMSPPGAEWQLDRNFNAAEEIARNPELKETLKAAIATGVIVVTLR
jgi:hypothetical protein